MRFKDLPTTTEEPLKKVSELLDKQDLGQKSQTTLNPKSQATERQKTLDPGQAPKRKTTLNPGKATEKQTTFLTKDQGSRMIRNAEHFLDMASEIRNKEAEDKMDKDFKRARTFQSMSHFASYALPTRRRYTIVPS